MSDNGLRVIASALFFISGFSLGWSIRGLQDRLQNRTPTHVRAVRAYGVYLDAPHDSSSVADAYGVYSPATEDPGEKVKSNAVAQDAAGRME